VTAVLDTVNTASAMLNVFYRVPRVGQVRLSGGGGPFGFDITTALQVDYLVHAYGCDGIVETGCFLGDTTEYLGRYYHSLPVRTCDIDPAHADFTRRRVRGCSNVTVYTGDSTQLIPTMFDDLRRPLLFLDAHWNADWPLAGELRAVTTGVICVDDFAIGHDRFGFDVYDGQECGAHLVADALPDVAQMWIGNPFADYPLPCLQNGRRSGTGYLPVGVDPGPMTHPMFLPVPLRPVRLPDWAGLTGPTEERS